jgi:hypothetical protein
MASPTTQVISARRHAGARSARVERYRYTIIHSEGTGLAAETFGASRRRAKRRRQVFPVHEVCTKRVTPFLCLPPSRCVGVIQVENVILTLPPDSHCVVHPVGGGKEVVVGPVRITSVFT